MDKEEVPLESLSETLKIKAQSEKEPGVLLFADRSLPYQRLFRVLDEIRNAGIHRISLQAEGDQKP
jgi:biopolymer transport protein ExbD